MNLRNSETFHESLISQYRDLIQEAVFESETQHKSRMDIGKLNSKLKVILKAAKYDGIEENVITDLINRTVPKIPALAA